jgi:pimeloyl-ACP methyl ester carboxylesterase
VGDFLDESSMTTYKEETLSVRGRQTRLYRGGDGPPLLFLHDPFCPSWLPLHEKLAADYEVFLPIHPGFAGSDDGFDQFEEMEDLVFHYLDLCAALGLQRPALAGASFGGWIAAEWAIRYGQRLTALILIDALGLRVHGALAADILSLDGAALRQILFADPGSVLAMATLPDALNAEDMISTILARRTLARFAWQFPDNPRLGRYLDRVRIPTLILWGERDGYVSPAHGKAYQAGIAKSELRGIPNVGHLPHIEASDTCANLILAFLRKTDG